MAGKPGRSGRKAEARKSPSFPPISNFEPPEWLDGEGLQMWREILAVLSRVDGLLSDADRGLIAMYCEAYAEFRVAATQLGDNYVIMSEKGGQYQNPLVGVKNKALERMKSLSIQLGLSPSARATLKLGSAEPKTDEEAQEFAKLLKIRNAG